MTTADADLNAAFALFQAGDLAGAEAKLGQVLSTYPGHVQAIHLLGGIMHSRGEREAALALFDQAASLAPSDASIAFNRAAVLMEMKRWADADQAFAAFLALHPNDAQALNEQGFARAAMGRHDLALANYDAALYAGIAPGRVATRRGVSLAALGRSEEALWAFDAALAADPRDAWAHYNRGKVLAELARPDAALAAYEASLALKPGLVDAWNNRGGVLLDLGRLDDALKCYERALQLEPSAMRHLNRGNALSAMGRPREAIVSFDDALALDPDLADAAWGKAFALLRLGDFAHGLVLYESRWLASDGPRDRPTPAPMWEGGKIAGKTLLVQCEQGLGDSIQHWRYLQALAHTGARVVVEERALLAPMLARQGVSVVAEGQALPRHDVRVAMMSLPLLLGVTPQTIPPPKLSADARRVVAWRARLPRERRVGVAWRGSQRNRVERTRSLPAAALTQLLSAGGGAFVSLHFDPTPQESALLAGAGALSFGEAIAPFEELAALIAACDMVVSVDTVTAHLAGSLGIDTRILLPFVADPRWLMERDDTPLYPSARLYRQTTPGDWIAPIAGVTAALQR